MKRSFSILITLISIACTEGVSTTTVQLAGACHDAGEFGYIFRPCEDQESSCETVLLGQRYKHSLYSVMNCRECMEFNELISEEIERICRQYDVEVTK